MLEQVTGICNVRFVGEDKWRKLNVDRVCMNIYGHILYVLLKDGSIINWSNIVVIRKV